MHATVRKIHQCIPCCIFRGAIFLSRRVQEVTKMHSQGKGIHYFLTKCLDASKKCHYKGDKKHFPELQDSRVSILKLVPGAAECDLA